MTTTLVRLAIAGWILVTLARAARAAWHQRDLVRAVWRAWRPVHLLGVLGLLVVVGGVASALLVFVPYADVGLGTLLGTETNAVFSPLEQAVAATGPAPDTGPDWALVLLSTGFLLPLGLLLPWLAFVEEEVFRGGLEDEGLGGQAWRALLFGLAHLVMLVPVAAALAIGVAGFVYGRIYLRAHREGAPVPTAVRRGYRPSKRGRRALERRRPPVAPLADPTDGGLAATSNVGVATDHRALDRQMAGVFRAGVWHAAFNTTIVVLVWASLVVTGLTA